VYVEVEFQAMAHEVCELLRLRISLNDLKWLKSIWLFIVIIN